MRVESQSSANWLTDPRRREADHNVQDVFSAVLAEAGREGYASAEPVSDEQPLTESITGSWSNWFDGERLGRYLGEPEAETLKNTYVEILLRAHQEGGYAEPKAFLQQLSSDELDVVQRVHHLANRIQVDPLTDEGAVNLLLPPAAQVDVNDDGLTQSGIGYGIRFPDSTTPPEVAQAWDEATADLDFKDRMIYELQMKLPVLLANIHLDDSGQVARVVEPGDPDFVNPLASPDYSYAQTAQDRLEYLDYFKPRISPERYERDYAFWSDFQQALAEHGAT